ncbi:methylated-DNA--[protein]-cysteine S-methyltransferase [Colwellia psychrerythraea]|uniref:Methylated-DNA--protein-cysteine methyltransferase n=1 Tax=Colwellia psychrerythraea TaxID=28229 RepID=A0A099L3H3_COLPS|nr:methylated-DNA--[protein]-cysteine S-methyltransferase [Colwellia psychrerythraea]KGJ97504.1 Methylated-DNA--protein-cysteine methyltransferase [Colwellia psychrerythraea]
MFIDYLDTPLGLFEFMATEQGICQAIFCGEKLNDELFGNEKPESKTNAITKLCKQQLTEYFSGSRQIFTVPLDPQGTPFQHSVWHCLSQIPFGELKSYGDIAKILNKPKAAQAVGGANGRNPITLIVPCHRVIGGDGSLTGYAGGIERKLWLLNHEGAKIKLSDEYTQLDIKNVIHQRQAKTKFLR